MRITPAANDTRSKSHNKKIKLLFSGLTAKYSFLSVLTVITILLSSSLHAVVCEDSGVDGALTTAEVSSFGITTSGGAFGGGPDDGSASHVLDTITISGTTFTDFINPTGYDFQFTALTNSVPPGLGDPTDVYRMDQGTPTTNFLIEGAAGWPAAILDVYQSRNLNLYQGYDDDINAGDFYEVNYATPISSTDGLFVGWTERFGNNGVDLQAFDAAGVALGGPVTVTPGGGDVFGPGITYLDTGVGAASLTVGSSQSIGLALFPIDDLAPVGSQVSSIRVFPVGSTTDAGDGKVFIFGDEDVASCVPAAPSIESVMDVADTNGSGVFGDVGDIVTYEFTVENTGNTALANISVDDTGLSALTGAVGAFAVDAGFDGDLIVGEGPVVAGTVTYTLAAADIAAGEVENTATTQATAVALDAGGEPDPAAPIGDADAVTDDSDTGTEPTAVDSTNGDVVDVAAEDTDGVAGNDGDEPTVLTLVGVPAIQLLKTIDTVTTVLGADPALTDAGDTITYAFTVNNTGTTALQSIAVTDALLGAPIVCAATTLPVGGSTTCTAPLYTIVAADVVAGFVENTAEVDSEDPANPGVLVEDTSDAGDDTAETPDGAGATDGDPTNDPTVVPLGGPAIQLFKTISAVTTAAGDDPALTDAGDTITYAFTVNNTGGTPLQNIAITDALLGAPIVCALTTLPVGGTTSCTAPVYTITAADVTAGFVENTADVASEDPANPGVPVEDTSDVGDDTAETPDGSGATDGDPTNDPTVQPLGGPAIQLLKTVSAVTTAAGTNPALTDAGDTITYAFTVNNTGSTALENIAITDALLGAPIVCAATTLPVGGTTTCTAPVYTITAADAAAGFVENTATVASNDPADPGTPVTDISDAGDDVAETPDGSGATDGDPTNDPVVVPLGVTDDSIILLKRASRNEASIGDVVQYTLELRNNQALAIPDADIIDNIPAGFQFEPGSGLFIRAGADGAVDTADDVITPIVPTGSDPITFNNLSLAAGEIILVRYFLRVTTGVGEGDYTNTAQTFGVAANAISNAANATVRIVQDPILQKTTIIGKVFADHDEDGWQDPAYATNVKVHSDHFGWDSHLIGGITGRTDDLDPFEEHQAIVRMPITDNNEFHVSTAEGTLIKVMHDGEVIEEHSGAKENGLTGQDLRVTTEKDGNEMVITIRNYGIQEQGIPGVRVATVEGLIIETDHHGRFHLADVDGGRFERGRNFIMKVDDATLPEGSEFTTENPRVLRITQSLMSKFNFGVKLPPQQLIQKVEDVLRSNEPIEVKTLSNLVEAVRFRSGKSDIPDSYRDSLQRVVDLLSDKEIVNLEVIGHTDTDELSANARAIYQDNYGLSNARAEEVAAEIQKLLSIPVNKVQTKGFGPDQPVATNATEAGKARNRRVEVRETHEEKVYQEVAKQQVVNRQAVLPNGGQVWAVEDPSKQDPRLDVLFHDALVVSNGQIQSPVSFNMYSNYLAFIDHWQVEIYKDNNVDIVNPVAVIKGDATDLNKIHQWNASELSARDIREPALWYVLRVFDSEGRHDSTTAKRLAISSDAVPGVGEQENVDHEELARSIFAKSSLSNQTIPLHGSRVRVNGRNIESNKTLLINNVEVPVSDSGDFVHEQHLPIGTHALNIKLLDAAQSDDTVERELAVKVDGKYMFLVGLANLTIGDNDVGGNIEALNGDDNFDDDVFVDGRLAFYLKGKVKGKYLITAQLDTTEAEINDLHNRIDDQDPSSIFRQLDPDKYYSVYGDDSTTIDDTDSQGNIYLRIDWDKSNALWGNYNTDLTGTEFAQYNRSLYGAKLEHRNLKTTKYGDTKHELHAFASEANTAAAHNSFNATGGSLYYLRDTQVVQGSEKIWVEVRSRDTEQVVESYVLQHGEDYDIDYLQGRIILTRPLTQIALASGPNIIQDGPLEGNDVFLLADYEFQPDGFETDDLTVGIRGKAWINDYIALGGTYVDEERDGTDYELKGADVTLRAGKGTYLKFEYAESDAQQAANSFASANGGISFNGINQQSLLGNTDTDGEAIGLEGRINLSEFTENQEGFVMAWYKDRDEGFSSVARLDDGIETTDVGLHAEWKASDALTLSTKVTNLDRDDLSEDLNASVQADYGVSDRLSVGAELRYEDIDDQTVADQDGDAVLSGLALRYKVNDLTEVYTSGQVVLSDSGDYESNAQATVGISKQVNHKLSLIGELTSGDRGDAVVLGGEYAITPNMNLSLNAGFGSGAATTVGTNYTMSNGLELYGSYAVDPDRTDSGNNLFTFGSRRQYQNGLSIYSESQFGEGDEEQSAARTYGLDFDLTDQWRLSASLQTNDLDRDAGDIDRRSATIGASYKGDTMKFGTVLEYREDDDNALGSDNTQWITSNTIEWQRSESLRLLGKLDLSTTHSDSNKNDEAKYVELDLGFAYRPTNNDRLNILGKYTFLYDLATSGQDTSQPDERSHIFSIEALYDVNNEWEIGGKLAYRAGDIRLQRGSGPWFETGAHLAVVRARYHLLKKWDALFEYRWLENETDDDDRDGALLGAYRHVGKHMKIGAGYNFTDFSDDLTDNDYDSDGWFFDIVGKY